MGKVLQPIYKEGNITPILIKNQGNLINLPTVLLLVNGRTSIKIHVYLLHI